MSSQEKNALKKAKCREKQSKIRQALMISDYVNIKYSTIYQEAAEYYNELNSMYPLKSDLTKCDEFKALKMIANGAPIRIRKYSKFRHTNIPLEQRFEIPVQPLEQPESSTSTVQPVELEQRFEIPVQPLEQPESPISTRQSAKPTAEKVMELKIPLLKTSVVTQTLQIHTEQTIQENPLTVAAEVTIPENPTFHPSLMEEIPQNVIDRIINELRQDPELETIMTEIEEDIEFEQVGMDLDVSNDDRLENYLENLMG